MRHKIMKIQIKNATKKKNILFGIESSVLLAISYLVASASHSAFAFLYISISGLHCVLLAGIIRNRSFTAFQSVFICMLTYTVSFIALKINGFNDETVLSSIQNHLLAWVALCPMPYFIYSIVSRLHGVKYVEIDR